MEAARDWYDSKEYQDAISFRQKAAEWRVVLVFPQIHFNDEEQIAFTTTLGPFACELGGPGDSQDHARQRQECDVGVFEGGDLLALRRVHVVKDDRARLLAAKVPSERGTGETQFANTYAARDPLRPR